MPPTEFDQLADSQIPDAQLCREITKLLAMKKAGEELDMGERIQVINDFLESELERYVKYTANLPKSHPPSTALLDELFRETLAEVWENTSV